MSWMANIYTKPGVARQVSIGKTVRQTQPTVARVENSYKPTDRPLIMPLSRWLKSDTINSNGHHSGWRYFCITMKPAIFWGLDLILQIQSLVNVRLGPLSGFQSRPWALCISPTCKKENWVRMPGRGTNHATHAGICQPRFKLNAMRKCAQKSPKQEKRAE